MKLVWADPQKPSQPKTAWHLPHKFSSRLIFGGLALLVAGMLPMLFSCQTSKARPEADKVIQLAWTKPGTISPTRFFPRSESLRVSFELVDQRSEGLRVAYSNKNQKHLVPKNSLIDAYYQPMADTLVAMGLKISDKNGAEADITLRIAIKSLFVEEAGAYHGKTYALVEVLDKDQVLISEDVLGKSNRWGSSFSMVKYNETFTNTIIDLIQKIGRNIKIMPLLRAKK